MKKTVVFDFDGVIHSYESGWQGVDKIPDPPVAGIKEAIEKIRAAGYQVVIVSTRTKSPEGSYAISKWLDKYGIEVDDISLYKPPAVAYVDDRAITFDGNAAALPEKILNFVPWYQAERSLPSTHEHITSRTIDGVETGLVVDSSEKPTREFLFRGKRKDTNEWVVGWFVGGCNKGFLSPFEPSAQIIDKDGWWHEVDPSAVGQYTGLTDKNGTKIFEGDIVEFDGEVAEVAYVEKFGAFRIMADDWWEWFGVIKEECIEVIGNIHDNHELLEVSE